PLYAPDQTTYQRMYLHAFQVRFTKPLSDTTLTVTSPLPF
ncbi:putative RNA pseudouridine synthase YlyB, partial [Lacticaseibacillus paracasei subsp. paracasei Lpp48]